jgi:hypothetical protein
MPDLEGLGEGKPETARACKVAKLEIWILKPESRRNREDGNERDV